MGNETIPFSEVQGTTVIDSVQTDSNELSTESLRIQIETILGYVDAKMSDFQDYQLKDLKELIGLTSDQIEKDETGDVYILTKKGRLTLLDFIRSQ